MPTQYEEEGFACREEYLHHLAEEYSVSIATVNALADVLGEEEDFDLLVRSLQDIS